MVEAIPLTDFLHGKIDAREGKPLYIENALALELERAGLVRINLTPGAAAKKAGDDGAGQASSASAAAPVSTQQTLHLPKDGATKRRKSGMQS